MKKVLAAGWHGGGCNAIIPVLKRLREQKKVDLLVVGHAHAGTDGNATERVTTLVYDMLDHGVNSRAR